jgi:hypothetical protein
LKAQDLSWIKGAGSIQGTTYKFSVLAAHRCGPPREIPDLLVESRQIMSGHEGVMPNEPEICFKKDE